MSIVTTRIRSVASMFFLAMSSNSVHADITLEVGAESVLSSAGQSVVTLPSGTGTGMLPVEIDIPAGVTTVTFPTVTGSFTGGTFWPAVGPDGGTIGPLNQTIGTNILSYNGISGIKATQFGFLAGVFVGSQAPVAGTEPPVLDFTKIGTNFTQLSPLLDQSFYIGNGQTSSGTIQQFVVPTGATRLYLGFEDSYNFGWPSGQDPGYYDDNTGMDTVTVSFPEPSPFSLWVSSAMIFVSLGCLYHRMRIVQRVDLTAT